MVNSIPNIAAAQRPNGMVPNQMQYPGMNPPPTMAHPQIIAQQQELARLVMANMLNNRPAAFLPQLAEYMAQRGSPLPPALTGVPKPNYDPNTSRFRVVQPGSSPGTFRIADKDVDLHMLLIWVLQRGGAKESTPWEAFVAHAGLPATIPHMIPGQPDIKVSAMIQQYYINLLLPFEPIWAKMVTKIALVWQQRLQKRQQQQQQQQAAMQQGGPANGAQLSNLQGPAGMPSHMHAQANAPAHGFGAISSTQNHHQVQFIQPQQPHALPQQNRSYPLLTQPQPHVHSIQLPRTSPRSSTLDLFHSRHSHWLLKRPLHLEISPQGMLGHLICRTLWTQRVESGSAVTQEKVMEYSQRRLVPPKMVCFLVAYLLVLPFPSDNCRLRIQARCLEPLTSQGAGRSLRIYHLLLGVTATYTKHA
ncbi:hypothetical protein FRC03_006318 [Tulasnella sp. 419]|nr:hypothetical protein FRC03_006318 [Tulasnella sp. 419]